MKKLHPITSMTIFKDTQTVEGGVTYPLPILVWLRPAWSVEAIKVKSCRILNIEWK